MHQLHNLSGQEELHILTGEPGNPHAIVNCCAEHMQQQQQAIAAAHTNRPHCIKHCALINNSTTTATATLTTNKSTVPGQNSPKLFQRQQHVPTQPQPPAAPPAGFVYNPAVNHKGCPNCCADVSMVCSGNGANSQQHQQQQQQNNNAGTPGGSQSNNNHNTSNSSGRISPFHRPRSRSLSSPSRSPAIDNEIAMMNTLYKDRSFSFIIFNIK